ncbi:MAG: hypothetical protein AVDCRST_MAG68-1451, partial [uncultured Gemmatimonadetes bacterium]
DPHTSRLRQSRRRRRARPASRVRAAAARLLVRVLLGHAPGAGAQRARVPRHGGGDRGGHPAGLRGQRRGRDGLRVARRVRGVPEGAGGDPLSRAPRAGEPRRALVAAGAADLRALLRRAVPRVQPQGVPLRAAGQLGAALALGALRERAAPLGRARAARHGARHARLRLHPPLGRARPGDGGQRERAAARAGAVQREAGLQRPRPPGPPVALERRGRDDEQGAVPGLVPAGGRGLGRRRGPPPPPHRRGPRAAPGPHRTPGPAPRRAPALGRARGAGDGRGRRARAGRGRPRV